MTDRDFVRPNSGIGLMLTLFLAVCGPALWLLWPEPQVPEVSSVESRKPRGVRFIFKALPGDRVTFNPTLMALPSAPGFTGQLRSSPQDSEALSAVRPHPETLLSRAQYVSLQAGVDHGARLDTSPDTSIPRYVPIDSCDPVFPSANMETSKIVRLELTSDFKGLGFKISEALTAVIPMTNAWTVGALVEVDDDGHVVHVLVDRPFEDSAVNAAAVRMLYYGIVDNPGTASVGRVTVSSD